MVGIGVGARPDLEFAALLHHRRKPYDPVHEHDVSRSFYGQPLHWNFATCTIQAIQVNTRRPARTGYAYPT